jgi:hypothetical protein
VQEEQELEHGANLPTRHVRRRAVRSGASSMVSDH